METMPRHQCLIYDGPPSINLSAIAAVVRRKLAENFRCLYLNSPVMVAGMRSYLAAAGIDVAHEVGRASLVLSSDRRHLVQGEFDIDRMMHTLEDALDQALGDGYEALWATGDMSWEFGPKRDFSKLLEYEWRLEECFRKHTSLAGICQYHAETLPREVLQQGLLTHPAIFVNETLSRINPRYVHADSYTNPALMHPELGTIVDGLLRGPESN
jgi:catalase (peroxidase I)